MTYVRKLGVGSWAPLLLSPPLIHTVLVQLSSAVRYNRETKQTKTLQSRYSMFLYFNISNPLHKFWQ